MNKVKKFLYSQKAAPYVFILPFVLTVILGIPDCKRCTVKFSGRPEK